MISVEVALRRGFALVNRSPGLVFLDSLWKAVWLAATMAFVAAIGVWFGFQLRTIEWQAPNLPGASPLILAGLLREIWSAYAGRLFGLFTAAAAASMALWILLEAYVRSRVMGKSQYSVFLLSGIATRFVMAAALVTSGLIVFNRYLSAPVSEWPGLWADTRGAFFVSVVLLAALGFLLKLFETAVRSDSVELLGGNLFQFAGLLGTLMVFEWLVDVAVVVLTLSAAFVVASPEQMIAVAVLGTISIVVLSLLNSYLLLVRFSAVGIMSGCECKPDRAQPSSILRHDAVEI